MTVAELISKLQEFDEDMEVCTNRCDESFTPDSIDEVRISSDNDYDGNKYIVSATNIGYDY